MLTNHVYTAGEGRSMMRVASFKFQAEAREYIRRLRPKLRPGTGIWFESSDGELSNEPSHLGLDAVEVSP